MSEWATDRWAEWRAERRGRLRAKGHRRPCPCCGCLTLESDAGDWEICPVCYWEDDPVQLRDPSYRGGANKVSLEEARSNYQEHGVSELRFKDEVRSPAPEEMPAGIRKSVK